LLVAVGGWPARARLIAALGGLLLAGVAEAAFILELGAGKGGLFAVARAMMAGAALALILDLVVRAARWAGGRTWPLLATALGVGVLLLPPILPAYEHFAEGRPAAVRERPPLAVLTGLPLFWGEAGLGAAPQPNAAFAMLRRHFTIDAFDSIARHAPPRHELMLIAQPRALAPEEFVALDDWVRGGGRLVMLLDPDLRWPSVLPPGDPRRMPATVAIDPLLARWGLMLRADGGDGWIDVSAGDRFRAMVEGAGRLVASRPGCRVQPQGIAAECAIGRGRAMLIADADLLRDDLWIGPGEQPRFDNGPLIVALLDRFAVPAIAARAEPLDWIREDDSRFGPIAAGFAVPLALAAVLLLIGLGRGRGVEDR